MLRVAAAVCVTPPQLVQTLEGHSGSIMSLIVSPDGRFVYSGSSGKTVEQWDASNGAVRAAA
jgi:WD40 repeat protein